MFLFLGDYGSMGESQDKRLGFKSQFCLRPAGTFEKEFHQFGPQLRFRTQFQENHQFCSALNSADIPDEGYGDLGPSLSYCKT